MDDRIQPAPPPNVFLNEDTSKPENRVNLALFGLLNVAQFRDWFVRRLHLPDGCVIYPPRNVNANLRPDFVVALEGDVYGWIEVELGPENNTQLSRYRDKLDGRVISVVGLSEYDGDLSLEAVADTISDFFDELSPQQQKGATLFRELVTQCLAGVTPQVDYVDPGPDITDLPIIHELTQRLGEAVSFGSPPVRPGKLMVTTITQWGWTLRTDAPAASMRSVSLMWDQSVGRGMINFPSTKRLQRCIPGAAWIIAEFAEVVRGFGADIEIVEEGNSCSVPEESVKAALDRLAPVIGRLANPPRE